MKTGLWENLPGGLPGQAAFAKGLFLFVFIGSTELFQLYDARFIPDLPRDDLSGVFTIIRLDDGPAAMCAVVTAPLKMMEITRCVDFPDDGVALIRLMW